MTDRSKSFSDNGVGLPEDVDLQRTDSLGLQVINTLVGHIKGEIDKGEIEIDRSQGTEFKIIFKELEYKKRF